MNDSTRVIRRPRPRPSTAMTAIAIVATALLVAACGSSGSSSAGSGRSPGAGGSSSPQSSAGSDGSSSGGGGSSRQGMAFAYSHCMRSHGVTRFPDPGPARSDYTVPVIPSSQAGSFGVSVTVLTGAQNACQRLLPPPPTSIKYIAECDMENDCTQSLLNRYAQALLKFARCMRTNGVPNWPDPTWLKPHAKDPGGRFPGFWIPKNPGFNPHSSQVMHIMNDKCDHVAGIQAVAIDGPGG